MSTAAQYFQKKTIQYVNFSDIDLGKSKLSVLLNNRGLFYCVCDVNDTIQHLNSYQINNHSELLFDNIEWLYDLFEKDELLVNAFKFDDITVSITPASYTLVPQEFFEGDDIKLYHNFNLPNTVNEQLVCDEVRKFGHFVVYGVKDDLTRLLDKFLEDYTLKHSISSLIPVVIQDYLVDATDKVVVNKEADRVDIFISVNGHFKLVNTFTNYSPTDFLYYLLNTGHNYKFDFKIGTVVFLGDMTADDEECVLAKRYINKMFFGSRPRKYTYCDELDAVPYHQFFNLFCI